MYLLNIKNKNKGGNHFLIVIFSDFHPQYQYIKKKRNV